MASGEDLQGVPEETGSSGPSFDTIYHNASKDGLAQHPEYFSMKNPEGISLLFRAVCDNDLERLQIFLDVGCDVNVMCGRRTPLFWAIHTFRLDAARMLIEAGCDVNISCRDIVADDRGSEGDEILLRLSTPLLLAVRQCQKWMVDLLLAKGSRIDEPSILHEAIRTGNAYILQKLLDAGACVNREDHKGWTPLSTALIKEEPEMVHMILKKNPDVHKEIPFIVFQNSNKVYFSPLALASVFDKQMISVLVAAGADPCRGRVPQKSAHSHYLKMCMAPICNSVGKNCTESLRFFIHENCPLIWNTGKHAPVVDVDPEDQFNTHDSVLFVALWTKAKGCIKLLLEYGFDIHCCGNPTKSLVKKFIRENKGQFLSDQLECRLERPMSLLLSCRNVIRGCIGLGISKKISHIDLPPILKEFVLLSDVLETSANLEM